MKIKDFELFPIAAGWRIWLLLRIRSNDGVVGWADCTDAHGSLKGLAATIEDLLRTVIGRDAMATELIFEDLYRITRQSAGGLVQKALAAIENALMDLKARHLGIPVAALLGGTIRQRIPLYWSHCATTRLRNSEQLGGPRAVRSVSDATEVAAEARERGFAGIKTNLMMFPEGDAPYVIAQGFKGGEGSYDRNLTPKILFGAVRLMEGMRSGLGEDRELILDINMHFRVDGVLRLARALEPLNLAWLEVDLDDPAQLAALRMRAPIPIGSCEKRQLMSGYKPFLDAGALDVAITDVRWTGIAQAKKIADLARLYEVNVAPHNHGSPLASMMSAHFCAAIANLRLMEFDVDDVPWRDDLVTVPPRIEDGWLVLSDGPGWGTEIIEEKARRRAP